MLCTSPSPALEAWGCFAAEQQEWKVAVSRRLICGTAVVAETAVVVGRTVVVVVVADVVLGLAYGLGQGEVAVAVAGAVR